ncbi:MAG: ABC transporter ATP-binding protein [Deltaproteobacteria bacterium]|nr:ABC transporter ATP-binding protein [Deltaproteobacteria bacterium]MBW1956184.1 ABC transporter ATP-binding protein [Deltaproteobacteria bacterium]MBW2042959.1 ABC transporter ATP-binding protein [Deltaproteobacteria bacterium]MBW2132542.1 ABC transporter ATP-binding protein [Deltaproteobacteria bacterium]
MLKIDDIHVYRGRTHVLKGVSLHVQQGEIVSLIGGNGAGKTTILRTISGLLRPSRGKIFLKTSKTSGETDISRVPAETITGLGVTHCPEGRGIFSQLSVKENLMIGAYLRKDKEGIADDYARVCALFPILGSRSRQTGGSLSGGEQEMLAVGRALMSRPELLTLDEPSLGLGPIIVDNLFSVLAEINRQGVTLLLVEQNAIKALKLSHRTYVLETGRMALSGLSAALIDNEKVKKAYLGGT